MDDNPFGYPIRQYAWVIGVASIAGLVKHINSTKKLSIVKFAIDVGTAAFTGVLTFWFCEFLNVHGPMSAILIATGGLMGNKTWKELEALWRSKLGVPAPQEKEDAK
jgi:hypothetical protein